MARLVSASFEDATTGWLGGVHRKAQAGRAALNSGQHAAVASLGASIDAARRRFKILGAAAACS